MLVKNLSAALFLNGYLFVSVLLLSSCQSETTTPTTPPKQAAKISFQQIDAAKSGLNFNNQLDLDVLKSYFDYINIFSGGGVAVGDINNDGLPDVCFTGNLVDNKLYINKGDFNFADITEKAGIKAGESWSTGVNMADVNRDGWLDIYITRSYHDEPSTKRENLLFINQGNPAADGSVAFKEMGKDFGVNDDNYSMHSAFLDFDKDGWIDLFVGNHPRNLNIDPNIHFTNFKNPKAELSDRLYRNNGDGTFTDVTKKAGILNYGWSLGITAADMDNDGWQDIYVAVDHNEPDKLYHNNGDGTFTNTMEKSLKHISLSSMGVDAADFNNDGQTDIYCVDMLAQDNYRQKTQMADMNPERFEFFSTQGYHAQYMRNMLQLNIGENKFSEIGQLAKLHETDWSWSVLFADLDNDGWKDLFVSNGYYRNTLDKDTRKKFMIKMQQARMKGEDTEGLTKEYMKNLTSGKLKNYCFKNNQDLTFSNISKTSGLSEAETFSNGAAYADFDQDGDLDLIVNNIDEPVGLFQNMAIENKSGNYLQILLKADQPIGTKVNIYYGDQLQYQELSPTRGFISAVEPLIHFGLGNVSKIDRLVVTWPTGKSQTLKDVPANQKLTLEINQAQENSIAQNKKANQLLQEVTSAKKVDFNHQENKFNDYDKQVLLPHKMSQLGPFVSSGDVNGDQLEDFYVGGAAGQSGQLWLQDAQGKFSLGNNTVFKADSEHEDAGAAFFDMDQDGDLDLYVGSGGNAFLLNSKQYADRLYLNDGKGKFTKDNQALQKIWISTSRVIPEDFDQDGDVDLFVGGRHLPWSYPQPTNSYVLENKDGRLIKLGLKRAAGLNQIGMVTDAAWTDLNKDGKKDLMVVGEWMSPRIFVQKENGFVDASAEYIPDPQIGWWNCILAKDLDGDGDEDFVLGNLGTNYKYKASDLAPFHVYADDYDKNGNNDIVLGYFNDNTLYPVRGRQCSSEQLPGLAEKFPTYHSFATASIEDVYGEQLTTSLHYAANNFKSTILINSGNGFFKFQPLPNEAQVSPINDILAQDFNGDGNLDLLVAGNLYVSEVETGRADAGNGLILLGDGTGQFKPLSNIESGIHLPGDVKDLALIPSANGQGNIILATNNNGPLQIFSPR